MPRMLELLDHGYDMVSGWKKRRLDPWHKVYPSRVFNRIISACTGVRLHDHVCGLKCFRQAVVKELRIYGEFHRFLGVLADARGFSVTEVPTLHRPRLAGKSKYGFARFAKGFLDLLTVVCLTRYRWRPQHLIGVTGLWLIPVALLTGALYCLLPAVCPPCGWLRTLLHGLVLLFLMAVPALILIAVGLVGQLAIDQRPCEEQYIIAERVGWCRSPDAPRPGPA
jgi:hypothetical protein